MTCGRLVSVLLSLVSLTAYAQRQFVAVKDVTASSTLAARDDRHAPFRALDGDLKTAWCEGAKGDGVGQTLTVTFAAPVAIDALVVAGGYRKSPQLHAANGVPTRIEVKVDGGRVVSAALPAGMDAEGTVRLGGAPVTSLEIKLAAVRRGSKYDDTCISGVSVSRKDTSLAPVVGVTPEALRGLPQALTAIGQAFATCDAKALAALVQIPIRFEFYSEDPDGKSRVARYASHRALLAACRKKGDVPRSVCHLGPKEVIEQGGKPGGAPAEVTVDVCAGAQIGEDWRLRWKDSRWQLMGIN